MKLPGVNCFITKFVILTLFQNIFVIRSWGHEMRVSHLSVIEDGYYLNTVAADHIVKPGQFPWMVMVYHIIDPYRDIDTCGGTVISSRWVLTAAHCIHKHPKRFLVVFGDVDKGNFHGLHYSGPGIAMMTTKSVLPSNYVRNDIGLLHMPVKIPFGETIQPIMLAGPDYLYKSFAGQIAIILGWGHTGPHGRGSRNLRWGKIPIISNTECSWHWRWLDENQMCTKANTGNDVCKGDSGGPLVLRFKRDKKYLQIGIVSSGDRDCPSRRPGVFTAVSPYYNWIKRIVGEL